MSQDNAPRRQKYTPHINQRKRRNSRAQQEGYDAFYRMHAATVAKTIMAQTSCARQNADDAIHAVIVALWGRHAPPPSAAQAVEMGRAHIYEQARWGDAAHISYVGDNADLAEVEDDHGRRRGGGTIGVSAAFDRETPRYRDDAEHDGPGLCDVCGQHIYWVPLNDTAPTHKLRSGARVTVSEGARFYMRCEIVRGDTPGSTLPHPQVDAKTGRHVRHVCTGRIILATGAYWRTSAEQRQRLGRAKRVYSKGHGRAT